MFGDDPNKITGREKEEAAPVMKGLQHEIEILAKKACGF